MSAFPTSPRSDLRDAIRAVREFVEKRLRTYRMAARDETLADLGRMQTLELGIEELKVLWEALEEQCVALARERERYAALFEAAPDAYFVTDREGKITEANAAALELLRATAPLVDKLLVRFVPLEHRDDFRARLHHATKDWGRKTWRTPLQRHDGARIEVELSIGGVRHPRRATTALCWLLREVA